MSDTFLGKNGDLISTKSAELYRVGVTNAADRGLDIWGNFGLAIQVKHIPLDEETIDSISSNIDSSNVIIVCKSCDENLLSHVRSDNGLNVQGIITEDDLHVLYEKALRGTHSTETGPKIMSYLSNELNREFPSQNGSLNEFMASRGYDKIEYDTFEKGTLWLDDVP